MATSAGWGPSRACFHEEFSDSKEVANLRDACGSWMIHSLAMEVFVAACVLCAKRKTNGRLMAASVPFLTRGVPRASLTKAVNALICAGFLIPRGSDYTIGHAHLWSVYGDGGWSAQKARIGDRIFRRDKFLCVYCGSDKKLCLDHIIPQCRGGSHEDDNLVTACDRCNSSKGNREVNEWLLPTCRTMVTP